MDGAALVADSATVTRRIAPNNFDALRLLAALMVILGHGQDMKGFIPTILWNFPISRIGLDIFFSISGYLVCDSWLRTPRLGVFLAKRALRIFPALIVCVALTALVLGPMTTVLPLWKYFGHHQMWSYFLNDFLYLKLNLPGVFTQRRLGSAVNGSLWSLAPEVLCYLVIPLMWLVPRFGRVLFLLAIMAGCGFLGLWMFDHLDRQIGLVYSADPKYVLVQVPFFMAGAALRLVAVRFPGMFRLDIACICSASLFYLPPVLGTGSVPYEWLTLAYLVIALGLYSTPVLNQAARFGDLSYGMYLYAFPMQQVVLDHGPGWGIVRCTLASAALAFFSWHLVEAPALRLKPRGDSRPVSPIPPAGARVASIGRPLRRSAGRSTRCHDTAAAIRESGRGGCTAPPGTATVPACRAR